LYSINQSINQIQLFGMEMNCVSRLRDASDDFPRGGAAEEGVGPGPLQLLQHAHNL
jgi:hypothetical protein